ncbi:MAG TPA: polymorphic toxin-type HINT domain-containing protein [Gemmatales bacterium]|nr:polymorphic toxin-type HINT domain-containing protein [Gemmatales bacterium]
MRDPPDQALETPFGDWLLTATGRWLMVEEVHDTGEVQTVYNFEVADHHTYFVGTPDWPALVWVHNAECVWDPTAKRWRDPKTGKFTKAPAPGTYGAGPGSQALDQLDGISRAQQRIRSGADGGRRIIDSIEGSRQTLKNQLRPPFNPSDWD